MGHTKPQTIVTAHSGNFDTLRRAFADGNACIMECTLNATGEKVAAICAAQPYGDEILFTPFAVFLNGNPYELLSPPGRELVDDTEGFPID